MALPTILMHAVTQFLVDLQNFRMGVANMRVALDGAVEWRRIERFLEELVHTRADIVSLQARPNAGEYVRRVFGSAAIDLGALLNAAKSAIETAGQTIRAQAPVDGNGWILAYKFSADPGALDQFAHRSIPTSATGTLRANCDAIVSAIDDLFSALEG